MAKVALAVIATNHYTDFIKPLLESAKKYLLKGHEVIFHLFTNSEDYFEIAIYANGDRIKQDTGKIYQLYGMPIECHPIEHQPWPAMTLNRYHIMSQVDFSGYDYVYYIDADMRFVAPVGDEIFGQLVAVQHPGYFRGGGGWELNRNSWAWMPECKRKQYIAGGFQGGSMYVASWVGLKMMIDSDRERGCIAKWHDESYWNRVKSLSKQWFKILDPSYCMVEEPEKRKLWGIDHLQPKIIALAKKHSEYQK